MFDWLNQNSRDFLNKGYIVGDISAETRIRNIADTAEKILGIDGFSNKFYDYMSKGWYSLSSPVWANFGESRGLPISCFGSHIEDTMDSILDTTKEVGVMTQKGGGTSAYFGDIRGRGEPIANAGMSDGSVNFMRLFNTLVDVTKQSGVRRGSFAAYLPVEHVDIEEFLQIKKEGNPIQGMFTGVTISDNWMQSMIDGDQKKRKVWVEILKSRCEIGMPYLLFSDNVNNNTVDVFKNNNLRINASNLCVTADQMVVTEFGMKTVESLVDYGENLTLFDGYNPVKTKIPFRKIEENAKVYEVKLKNGMSHKITDYHELACWDYSSRKAVKIKCKNLKVNETKVLIQQKKGLFGNKDLKDEAFLLGLYQSDGTQYKDTIMLDVWENDFDLLDDIQNKFNKIHYKYECDKYSITNQYGCTFERNKKPATFHECKIANGTVRKKRLSSKTLKKALNFEKGYIPEWIWESTEETQWEYIKSLLIADGTVGSYHKNNKSNQNNIQISYTDINKSFLKELQILLLNLGIRSGIYILRKAGKNLLPDGKGGHKYYDTKDCFRLCISSWVSALKIEEKTNFLSRKNVKFDTEKEYREYLYGSKIESITYVGEEDVYCCTVDSEKHLWTCNGFISSNCSEILLPSNSDNSFVCDLSSVNLSKYDEWKDTDAVETLIFFLDAVMTEFINKASNINGMERSVNFSKNFRALGLGVLGWHDLLQSKMLPIESLQSYALNNQIFSDIWEKASNASRKLYDKYPENISEYMKPYKRMNATLIAIAPTTSSAFILGQTSQSIEPLMSNYYVKDLAKGKTTIRNKHLNNYLRDNKLDEPNIWQSILKNNGSVQHLDIDPQAKEVFLTFSEISQAAIVKQAAQRQQYIDQGQSLNVMIHPETPLKEINELYINGWKQGIKTFYYQRSINAAQMFAQSLNACKTCEG